MAAGDITSSVQEASKFACNDFDGVDDYVEIPLSDAANFQTTQRFTYSLWVYSRAAEATNRPLYKRDGNKGIIVQTRVTTTPAFECAFGDGASTNIVAFTGSVHEKWEHLAFVFTGTTRSLYLNGALVVGPTVSNAYVDSTGIKILIGSDTAGVGANCFKGAVREVKFWNKALTVAQILEDYQGKSNNDGLVHYFKLGGDYNDYGRVGVAATNSGSLATNTLAGRIGMDMRGINLPATTDKIIALPFNGRSEIVKIIKTSRATA